MAIPINPINQAHPQVKTVTSTEFFRNVSAAKRAVVDGDTVIITDRGRPSAALIPIDEYRRMTKTDKNLVELLEMGGADDIDIEPVTILAQDIDLDE
jgi:prevent-host-death family protein